MATTDDACPGLPRPGAPRWGADSSCHVRPSASLRGRSGPAMPLRLDPAEASARERELAERATYRGEARAPRSPSLIPTEPPRTIGGSRRVASPRGPYAELRGRELAPSMTEIDHTHMGEARNLCLRKHRRPTIPSLLLVGVLVGGCSSTLGARLEDAHERAEAPAELRLTYEDVSLAWGGQRVELAGDGALEVRRSRPDFVRPAGDPEGELGPEAAPAESDLRRLRIPPRELARLIAVLVEIRAWEQAPSRGTEPVVDRGRARLRLRFGDASSEIWEWAEDLEGNDRLIRVRAELERLIAAAAPAPAPGDEEPATRAGEPEPRDQAAQPRPEAGPPAAAQAEAAGGAGAETTGEP